MVEPHEPGNASEDQPDTISIIADALLAKFGSRASEVARYQLDAAGEDTFKTWADVVSRLPPPADNRPSED